jgi:hypothetical protein
VVLPAADIFTSTEPTAGQLGVPVADGTPGLQLTQPGIYPITIDLVIDGGVVASTMTFLELLDPDATGVAAQPLAISIVAGVADPGPWPSATELSSASIEIDRLIELSDAVDGPLSIALPPGLVMLLSPPTPPPDGTEPAATSEPPASSVAIATAQPATTVLAGTPDTTQPAVALDAPAALTDAFRADELFAMPAIALDPSSLVPLGQADLFTNQLRAGEDVLSTASPRGVVSRAVWLSRDVISAGAMVTLRNLGIRMLVVPDDAATALGVPAGPDSSGVFAIGLAGDGTLPAITFSPLGAQLVSPTAGGPEPAANELAVRLLVELQVQRLASGTPAVVLATPRITVPDPEITAQFVDLAASTPGVVVVPISRLPGIVDRSLAADVGPPLNLPADAGDDLTVRLERVDEARTGASHAATMLVDPTRAAEWSAELDRAMSSAVDDATALSRVAETRAEIDRVLGAIVPPDSDTFRLTGTRSTLRLRIENTYDEPLNVVVHVRSPKLRFPEPDPLVGVPPGESRLVEIPVEARSNGTFTIEVDVLSPDRAPLSQPTIIKARVTRITGLSQVMTGAAGLVLASWWYSHFRRGRRNRSSLAEAGATAPDKTAVAVSPDAAEALARPPDAPEAAQRAVESSALPLDAAEPSPPEVAG